MKSISAERQQADLNNAIASVEIEGYYIGENEKNLCMEALSGRITKDEFIRTLLERCSV